MFPHKNQQDPKGAGRGSSVRAGRQGRKQAGSTMGTYTQDDGKKYNNPATDKGKSGTIYRRENRCMT